MPKRASSKRVVNGLVAVSSAAVLAVYAAGYTRTQSAADRIEGQFAQRPAFSVPPQNVALTTDIRPIVPALAKETAAPDAPAKPVAAAEPVEKPVAKPVKVKSEPVAASEPLVAKNIVPDPAPVVPQAPEVVPPKKPTAAQLAIAAAAPPWKDGTYDGWGTCQHGDIQASVVVEGGRITSATIAQCLTRYSCDIIDKLPPQVAKRQSPDVDRISGATQSADAFYWAVVGALGKAK